MTAVEFADFVALGGGGRSVVDYVKHNCLT